MTLLNLTGLALWLGVMVYMTTGALAVMRRKARHGDPMRLACFITAALFAGYIGRALWWPGETVSGLGLRLASMADAIYILALGRAYGRGQHL